MEIAKPPKIAISHSHSKLILIGEHAVVYGKAAIALPFPLGVTSTVESCDGGIRLEFSHYFGPLEKVPKRFQGIAICIEKTMKYLEKPLRGVLIRLHSEIPLGRGLGSSAAIACAIVKSLFLFYEKPISQKILMELVEVAEVYAHGNPSGIDMAAVSSDFPIWFQKGNGIQQLQVTVPLHLVVADSGKMSDTLSAVKKVRKNYRLENEKINRSIDQMGKIADMARTAFSAGDSRLLGSLLVANHRELMTLGVCDPQLNVLVKAAINEGALGAKMTGGGCGGCIIALARSLAHAEQIAKKLVKFGAQKTWFFTIQRNVESVNAIPS